MTLSLAHCIQLSPLIDCSSSKNIFKISLGEYIAPEKLENVFVQSKWVAQNWVYGDSLKSRLVGVVVPDFEVLQPWAKEKGHKDHATPAELVKDPAIVKMILDDMNEIGSALLLPCVSISLLTQSG